MAQTETGLVLEVGMERWGWMWAVRQVGPPGGGSEQLLQLALPRCPVGSDGVYILRAGMPSTDAVKVNVGRELPASLQTLRYALRSKRPGRRNAGLDGSWRP